MPPKVSTIATTVMPWVAARNGKVDVVYYGTSAATPDDTSAVWNVYDSQRKCGSWSVLQVSNTPNRVGAVCLGGKPCELPRFGGPAKVFGLPAQLELLLRLPIHPGGDQRIGRPPVALTGRTRGEAQRSRGWG